MDKPLLMQIVKNLNYASALLMVVDLVFRFTSFRTEKDYFFFLLTFYLMGFSLLLVIAEVGIERIIVYVDFLNRPIGKGVYIMFVGLLIFDDKRKSDMVIAIILVLIGLVNMLASCVINT
jgi:hypothetical protein